MCKCKIIQWNCWSIFQRFNDLAFLEEEFHPEFFCLSESKLFDSSFFSLPNYNIVAHNRDRHAGGTAILIKKNIKYNVISISSFADAIQKNIDIICIEVELTNNNKLTLYSLYSPPRSANCYTPDLLWQTIFNSCSGHNNVIICGDFNGHHTLWSNNSKLMPNIEGRKIERASEIA